MALWVPVIALRHFLSLYLRCSPYLVPSIFAEKLGDHNQDRHAGKHLEVPLVKKKSLIESIIMSTKRTNVIVRDVF